MTIPKQKFREALFLCLFSLDAETSELDSPEIDHLVELVMHELKMTKKNVYEALELARKVYLEKDDFDEKIRAASTSYEFERIPNVEKNIMRLGLYEMKELPGPIAISEAIRLSRKFSTAESASFVNAILDNIMKHGIV